MLEMALYVFLAYSINKDLAYLIQYIKAEAFNQVLTR